MFSKQKRKTIDPQQITSPQSPKMIQQPLKNSNQQQQVFSFRIGRVIDQSDLALCWTYNIPILKPNERDLHLVTETFQTVIFNYIGDDFPQTISFALRGFNGFLDIQGNVSSKFIIMNLVQTTINNEIGGASRDLVYRSQPVNVWNLGTLRNLRMELYVDNETTPVQMPLTNQINVMFRILHNST